ncbi:hypothetical protein HaLaN_16740 [Haematococcus lacustris]|uniref:BTB domain-containing protein n=1 Tax=Haematococcus lacustris TaxID=44745 RepID=A0A699ZAQ5_HAELA|nr:hypothetical protein HaLaN_16740 [Haematococcus lacustris]
MRELFEVVSPFFGQLLSSTKERFVKVVDGTTREQWLLIISQLYPLTPLPDLTLKQLGRCCQWLTSSIFQTFYNI